MQALYDSNANNLKAWLFKCPRMQITTLDTHDGLGIVDVADLMTERQVPNYVRFAVARKLCGCARHLTCSKNEPVLCVKA